MYSMRTYNRIFYYIVAYLCLLSYVDAGPVVFYMPICLLHARLRDDVRTKKKILQKATKIIIKKKYFFL